MRFCVVFNPGDPTLYTLNPQAWLVLELCDGRPAAAVEADYLNATMPPLSEAEARSRFRQGLDMLLARGMIECAEGESPP